MPHFLSGSTRWLTIVLLLSMTAVMAFGQGGRDSIFARANSQFEKGDFAAAEQQYRSLVKAGNASEDLFFNLGNAIYQQDRTGEAALWYHRALLLDPRMPEANQNLRVLKHRIGYLEFEPEGIDRFLKQLTEAEIVSSQWAAIWIAVLALVLLLLVFRRRNGSRTILLVVTVLAIASAIFSAWCLKRYRAEFSIEGRAIVVAPEARAVTGPVPDAEKVIDLPPGSEVRIELDRGAWSYVAIPGDVRGWVRTEMIEPISMDRPG